MIYDFDGFNFTSDHTSLSKEINAFAKNGAIVYLSIDDSKSDGNLFKIHSVLRNWTLEKSNILLTTNFDSKY